MSLEKNFCSSPWFHMRINNFGAYEYCRWANDADRRRQPDIKDLSPIQWFQDGIKDIRQTMLAGNTVAGCSGCHAMEDHGKISGRLRQLLKSGIDVDHFDKSLMSSPWAAEFQASLSTQGRTAQWPQDWQIDLGNYCNSACLFCSPHESSRLAVEFKKLGLIESMPPASWCEAQENVDRFVRVLADSPRLSYLHFLGGETLITPAFKTILQALIQHGLSNDITIGFTTNLTVWDQSTVDLLCQFKEVNLGMSIECLHPLNDYLRYPSDIGTCTDLLTRWVDLARKMNWLVQLRTTPTVFSIWYLDTIYEYAYQHRIAVESCNFLARPEHMRASVLPDSFKKTVIAKLRHWVQDHDDLDHDQKIVNTRNPNTVEPYLLQDLKSYVDYLENQPDESYRLPDLVRYIKLMEQNRDNSILTYLPEYEPILRSAGY